MKRIVTFLLCMVVCLIMRAQVDSTIIQKIEEADLRPQFLGIPVDGTKAEMISALKAKGFKYEETYDWLKGQFNGKDVTVLIRTNRDVVDRVYVDYVTADKSQIITQYNTLLRQFQNNSKYIELIENEPIDSKENISYEMTVNNKTYQAAFAYYPVDVPLKKLSEVYKADWMASRTRDFEGTPLEDITEEQLEALGKIVEESWDSMFELIMMTNWPNSVWFDLHESGTRYSISIFYDNKANEPNGEDL